MIATDQIKILDRKIKQNKAQYDLDRKAAKISALSSKNLPKYEHLTGEDLGYEPGALEQARFDYSPLSKFLNKGLKEDKKKEGPLKILKNIKGKNDEQLKAIEDQGNRQLDAIKNFETDSESLKTIAFFSLEAKKLLDEIKKEKNTIDSEKLVCVKTDGKFFNLNTLKN